MQVLANLAPLYLIALVSYILKQQKVFSEDTAKVLVPVMFKLSGPALVYVAISTQRLDASSLLLIGIGVLAFMVFWIVFGMLQKKLVTGETTQKALLLGGLSFAVGTIAYPLIQLSFPQSVFAKVVIIDLTLLILFMAIAPLLVSKENGKAKLVATLTKDPILLAVYLGVAASLLKVQLPQELFQVLTFAGDSFAFLSAVLLGVTVTVPSMEQFKKVFSAVTVKILLWVMLSVLIWFLPLSLEIKQATIMTISAPVGLFPVIYAKMYGLNEEFVAQMSVVGVFVTLMLYPLVIAVIV
jgi:predicted permease